ncbi:MAG: amidohydrolase family protein [Chloroflexi bacterium]|nr:amidohydrolase family protein [Chloroflexota bacterium]MDA1218454.1 amidohydrolase family protein [Chloroflexota bacterium]
MVVVDTHCHTSLYWFEPVEVLLDVMSRNGVDKAVLTQFFGVYDNSYLVDCMKRFPGRFSVIGLVDVNDPNALGHLESLHHQGVEGIRFNSAMRSPGSDPIAVWRKAEALGMIASVMGSVESYAAAEFENIIKELPNLKVVIEHLGGVGANWGPGRSDNVIPIETYQAVLKLAKYPNTYMKIPGLGEFCARPLPFQPPHPFAEVHPLIEMAVDAFGAERLMWGSDFPPVANREGYGNALNLPRERLQARSQQEVDWVFGKTADNMWKFGK